MPSITEVENFIITKENQIEEVVNFFNSAFETKEVEESEKIGNIKFSLKNLLQNAETEYKSRFRYKLRNHLGVNSNSLDELDDLKDLIADAKNTQEILKALEDFFMSAEGGWRDNSIKTIVFDYLLTVGHPKQKQQENTEEKTEERIIEHKTEEIAKYLLARIRLGLESVEKKLEAERLGEKELQSASPIMVKDNSKEGHFAWVMDSKLIGPEQTVPVIWQEVPSFIFNYSQSENEELKEGEVVQSKERKQEYIEVYDLDSKGENKLADTKEKVAKKNELFTLFGLYPDNGVLSNKLISILGQDILAELHNLRKADGYEIERDLFDQPIDEQQLPAGLREQVEQEAYNLHEEPFLKTSLQVRWRLTNKIRVLQATDLWFYRNELSVKNIDETIENLKEKLSEIYNFSSKENKTKNPKEDKTKNPKGVDAIIDIEKKEKTLIDTKLNELAASLKQATSEQDRNNLLREWQQQTFNELLLNFKSANDVIDYHTQFFNHRGRVNSHVLQDLLYAVQRHQPRQKQSTITPQTIWRDEEGVNLFLTEKTGQTPTSQHLYAALLSQHLQGESIISLTDFASPITLTPIETRKVLLATAEQHRRETAKIGTTSLENKAKRHLEKAKRKDELPERTSHYTRRYLALMYTDEERQAKRLSALRSCELMTPAAKLNVVIPEEVKSESESSSGKQTKLRTIQTYEDSLSQQMQGNTLSQPFPDSDAASLPPGLVQAFIYVFKELYGFVEKDMGAKRPYITAVFFHVPFMQFALAAMVATGTSMFGIPHLISHGLSVAEAKLINATLGHAHISVTADQIAGGVDLINGGLLWATKAKGMELIIVCGFGISKAIYTLADVAFNGFLSKEKNGSLIEELAVKLHSQSLTLKTPEEKYKDIAKGILQTIIYSTIAVAIGLVGSVDPTGVIAFLDDIPLDLLLPHTALAALQTVGAIKTSTLVIAKMFVGYDFISKGALVDANGHKITHNSAEKLALYRFISYASHPNLAKQDEEKNPETFKKDLRLFNEMLNQESNRSYFLKVLTPENRNNLLKLGVQIPTDFQAATSDDLLTMGPTKIRIHNLTQEGSLVDIHGKKIELNDDNYQVITYFCDLIEGRRQAPDFESEVFKKNSGDYNRIKHVFEDLLFMNSSKLFPLFPDTEKLKELRIKRVDPRWYHMVGAMLMRTVGSVTLGVPSLALRAAGRKTRMSGEPIKGVVNNIGEAGVAGKRAIKAVVQPPVRIITDLPVPITDTTGWMTLGKDKGTDRIYPNGVRLWAYIARPFNRFFFNASENIDAWATGKSVSRSSIEEKIEEKKTEVMASNSSQAESGRYSEAPPWKVGVLGRPMASFESYLLYSISQSRAKGSFWGGKPAKATPAEYLLLKAKSLYNQLLDDWQKPKEIEGEVLEIWTAKMTFLKEFIDKNPQANIKSMAESIATIPESLSLKIDMTKVRSGTFSRTKALLDEIDQYAKIEVQPKTALLQGWS